MQNNPPGSTASTQDEILKWKRARDLALAVAVISAVISGVFPWVSSFYQTQQTKASELLGRKLDSLQRFLSASYGLDHAIYNRKRALVEMAFAAKTLTQSHTKAEAHLNRLELDRELGEVRRASEKEDALSAKYETESGVILALLPNAALSITRVNLLRQRTEDKTVPMNAKAAIASTLTQEQYIHMLGDAARTLRKEEFALGNEIREEILESSDSSKLSAEDAAKRQMRNSAGYY